MLIKDCKVCENHKEILGIHVACQRPDYTLMVLVQEQSLIYCPDEKNNEGN